VRFSVLFICTGNICRSPAAELLFRARIDQAPIDVASAGTSGLSGHDVDLPTALVLREMGVDPSHHAARRLSARMITEADLVLTAAGAHRSSVVQLEPLTFRRTFTMREFARLGRDLPVDDQPPSAESLRHRVAAVAARRGIVEPAPPGGDDIADPFGAGMDAARLAVAAVSEAVDGVIRALGLVVVPSGS
jgi:protein-tyrosine phosphatase